MRRLSHLRSRATLALTLFVMALGVVAVAPLVRPVAFELVCSATGSRFVDVSDPGGVGNTTRSTHADGTGKCALCMPIGIPPALATWAFTSVQPRATVRAGAPTTRVASLVGAPLPARGPPLLT